MKPKLIILEGPESVGKTTQVKALSHYFKARLVHQPSETNEVGFIRQEVKFNEDYNPFERQLLFTISHAVDSYTEFVGQENLILDRSYISSLVYGGLLGIPKEKRDLLFKIQQSLYLRAISNRYQVVIVFLDRSEQYNKVPTDNFELSFPWKRLRYFYLKTFDQLASLNEPLFSPLEKVFIYNVRDFTQEKVTEDLVKLINTGI